jgi:hypothetical protein
MFGSSGTSGTSGTGISGTSGTSGSTPPGMTSGTSGQDGTLFGSSGTSGNSGTSGTTPPGMTSGTSGLDGTLFGTSGTSGLAGTSGTTPAGMTSGTSGTSQFPVVGSTDNGLLTYDVATVGANVEANITFNGSTLTIIGNTTQTGDVNVTGAVTATTYVRSTTFRETFSNLGSGGSATLDLSTANNFRRQFNATSTIAFSNPPASNAFGFTLVTVNAGAYTITWPINVDWAGGTAPILTGAGVDVLVFYTYDGGTTYYGFVTGKNLN